MRNAAEQKRRKSYGPPETAEGKQSSIKTNYEVGNEKCNIFHNQFPAEGKQSSIKVTQMPGGNSHVRYAAQQ